MDSRQINIQVLALLGDAIFTLYIREELIKLGINNPNLLQKKSAEYVSAKGQAKILDDLISNNVLTESEIDTIKRGRNNKKSAHPKNTDVVTYKISTGFEALLGELYLNNKERLRKILEKIEVTK